MNFCGNHAVVNDPGCAPADGLDVRRPARREGQPCHRGRPRQADRRVGAGAVHRSRLRRGDVLQRRRRPRPARRTRGHSAASAQEGQTSPARTTGAPSPPGRGAFTAPSITWSPTRTSTKSESPWSAIPAWARRRCWRPRSTSASPWPSRTRPAAAAPLRAAARIRRIGQAHQHQFPALVRRRLQGIQRSARPAAVRSELPGRPGRAAAGAVQQRHRGRMGESGRPVPGVASGRSGLSLSRCAAAWRRSACRSRAS